MIDRPGDLVDRVSPLQTVGAAVALVAVGHVLLLAVLPEQPPLATLAAVQVASLAVLLAGAALAGVARRDLAVLALAVGASVAVTWAALEAVDSLVGVALGVAAGYALVAYGIHRVELVALGLVEVPEGE